jgi:hypothetical protein
MVVDDGPWFRTLYGSYGCVLAMAESREIDK